MANPESSAASQITTDPLGDWVRGLRAHYRISPRWLRDLLYSAAAVPWKLVIAAPRRVFRLLEHLVVGVFGSLRWLFAGGLRALRTGDTPTRPAGSQPAANPEPPAATIQVQEWLKDGAAALAAWLGRLLAKTFDLFSLGELFNLLTMIFKVNTRSLTETEIEEAKKVFGDGLSYWRVRIDEWSLIAHLGKWAAERRLGKPVGDMAVTIFSTIHFSRRIDTQPGNTDMAWLIHELTHVAQNEHVGSQIIGEALHAQNTTGYGYGGPEALQGRDFENFNREQQGDIARHYYENLYADDDQGEKLANAYSPLIKQLRKGMI